MRTFPVAMLLSAFVVDFASAEPVTYLISGKFPAEPTCSSSIDYVSFERSLCGTSFQGYLTIDDVPTLVLDGYAEYSSNGYPYGFVVKAQGFPVYGFSDVRIQVMNDAPGYGPNGHDYVNIAGDLPNNGDTFFVSLFDFSNTAISEPGGKLKIPDVGLFQDQCLDNLEGCMLMIGSGGRKTSDAAAAFAPSFETLDIQKIPFVIPVPPGLLKRPLQHY
jgi:hypothetical protein